MSDDRWTSGSWSVEYNNSDSMGCGQWFEVVTDEPVCLLWCPYSAPDSVLEECKANATIMAASKDLYKSGSALIEFVMDRYNLKSTDELTCHHMRALAEALEKARGER